MRLREWCTYDNAKGDAAMVPNRTKYSPAGWPRCLAGAVVLALALCGGVDAAAVSKQKAFATPEEAVIAFIAALKSNDEKALLAIFGPDAKALISSGDPVGDRQRREAFLAAYERKSRLAPEGPGMVLSVGEQEWPFAIPLVQAGVRWVFDTKAGKEEILNRRVGENELDTVQTLLAIADAQREYALKPRDKDQVRKYAEKFASDPGRQNGLYWSTAPGEEQSPLGALAAEAFAEGYRKGQKGPVPYHGYYFRILKKQGKHAPGGAFDYVVQKRMIGGFAVAAYPAVYGSSGVMTFIVNHDGVVYQKDLGRETAKTATAMTSFDPDPSWKKVE
jgi:hypothetical protein